ncbi:signal peptide peptidase SppA [Psychrilyobacter sp.]|uniref:signal peptide peptidase SppA n=1 Tax=Psychrilyobacter sp. TaxID=2586924 RepID=UPI003018A5BA
MKTILKYIGEIILFFSKQVLQAILVVTIFLAIIVGVITATLTEYKKEVKIEKNTYLELDFSKGIMEKDEGGLFDLEKSIKLYQVLEGIKQASKESNIDGIYMDIDHVNLSVNHIEEVGEALDEFKKSGKKIYAFTRNIDNQNYRLGIYATKIVMPPIRSATINLSGYYREFNYFKNLADYVGIKFNVIHIGDYKAYGEQYSKEKMSKEFKKNIKRIYDRVYNYRIEEISRRRNIEEIAINKAVLGGELVLTNPIYGEKIGLIDGLSYQSEFDEKYGVGDKISLEDYLTTVKSIERKEKIALIYASGDIVYSKNRGGKNSIDIESIKKELKKADGNEDIKGIVLRVNSPGGSALASEIIHHEISRLSKPIYVSMGGVAASGGYYISAGAKKIFATKSTITGSIGVVSIIPEISGLVKKSMVNIEKIEKGRYSGINSLTAKMTPGEIKKIRVSSLGVYNEFKNRVSLGRNIPLDKLESIAGGRIWLGEEGIENGLVDEIGGLETTIKTLGRDLKLKDYQVVEIIEKKGVYEIVQGYRDVYGKVKSFVEAPVMQATRFRAKIPLLFMPYEFN